MRTIFKYQLTGPDHHNIIVEMPKGAEIVHCDYQDVVLTIWAKVDPSADKEDRTFAVSGTGLPIGDDWQYVGTTALGRMIVHVFETFKKG